METCQICRRSLKGWNNYNKNTHAINVTHDEIHECKFHGKVLLFEELLDGELVWSGKYGANIGEIGCQISLVVTSGCGKRVVYGPKSDCNYFTEISKRLDNRFVKSYPCSNRPVLCEQCQSYYWSYNLDVHYKQLHVGIQCPEQISQEERVFIISSKKM